jgi:SAM-dependent methyltransferase
VKEEYPDYFTGKRVLEVGSLNVNGTVRDFFTDCFYHGIDLAEGVGVDEVIHVTDLPDGLEFDVVISTEALEHDNQWAKSLKKMYDLTRDGGLLIVSCAGPQRPEHGTTRTDTYSSPFTTDYYRNISMEDFQDALPMDMWADAELSYARKGEDLYFRGLKVAKPAVVEQPQFVKEFNAEARQVAEANVLDFKKPDTLARKKHWTVTAEVCTKDRYTTTLPLTLSAIINQTHKPDKLKIYDDGEQKDLREMSPFNGLLALASDNKIDWEIVHTPRKGQVTNHQHCLDQATTDFIWRVDDDEIPEPNCLQVLLDTVRDSGPHAGDWMENVGAVGGLVHHPASVSPLPAIGVDGSLNDVLRGLNLQWFQWNGSVRETQHLYSTFLYSVAAAKDAGGYPRDLSTVGHREETIFSHQLARAGYKVLVTPYTKTYHLREATGGIRSFSDTQLWEQDEQIFQAYLRAWNIPTIDTKLIVCDFGLGDHLILKAIWPELKRKFPERKWTLALCFPEVFKQETDITVISIADAKLLLGNKFPDHSVYKHCWDNNFERPMAEVMLEFFSK